MELRPPELLKEWQSGRFRPVYYLYGEESAEKADALLTLKSLFKATEFNLVEFNGDPNSHVGEILSEAMTLPVFAEKRLVIVLSPKISAPTRATLAKYLQSPSITTTLVLLNEDRRPDKKDALAAAAAAAGAVCIFSPLNEQEANERIVALARAAGKTLAEDAAEILVNEAGTDWGILSSETEKLIIHAGNAPVIDAQSVLMCLGYRKSADPWAFDRLIQSRELKPCLTHLYELFNDGKIEDVVFRNLALIRSAYLKQLKAKRLLKAGQSQREIETKLRIFYDNGFWARASRVSEDRLRKDLRRCIEVEASLKSKAWLDPRIEFEQLVIELCTPTRTGVDLTVC